MNKANFTFLSLVLLPTLQLPLPYLFNPAYTTIIEEVSLPQLAFQYLSHPTRVCIKDQPDILNHPLMPKWEFSDAPPDCSPVLVLPRRGKVGIWSIKHRCVYLSGLGFLVCDGDGGVHLAETSFFSGGDFDFSAPTNGFHFNMTFSLNHWELPSPPCACHTKQVD